MPEICILDPDGDLVRYLVETDQAERSASWPGYHTELFEFELTTTTFGIIGCAVGAPFAVLVAEQLVASGCKFLISITSSGQIQQRDEPTYFVLIDRALRDEGTSHHYRQPEPYARLDAALRDRIEAECGSVSQPVYTEATWTTDAPFRETESAIAKARAADILAVEMEAAALYTFAAVKEQPVVCFAHVTNQMGQAEEDFEKGAAKGSQDVLEVIDAAMAGWRSIT